MRDLDPAVQNLIFDSFPGSDGPELFVLCAFFMNGYGTERNLLKALQKMKQAADMNFPLAQAYLYRISSACKSDLPGSALGVEYLYNYALIGSRAALEDLQIEGPAEKAQHARRFLDDACAGTGAPYVFFKLISPRSALSFGSQNMIRKQAVPFSFPLPK